ncbi:TetR/AcrR family transcriptional regulator [Exiguobacterium sp.]|uniref:TetR/AcrR family transcriptional regulator n=1 Tax=Exiguobacterium sp. TaxID=44751 RepID=UPI00391A2FF6
MGHEDLRIKRTKQLIKTAFLDLIDEHGFEAVTVKALTERAGINRGTFYSHYVDKFDLIEKLIEVIFHEAEQKLIKQIPRVFGDERGPAAHELLVPFIQFIEENKILMKPLLGPNGDPQFQARLRSYMHAALFQRSPTVFFDETKSLVPADYLVSYISSAHMGVIYEWLYNDRPETADDIARIIYTITFKGPLTAGGLKP